MLDKLEGIAQRYDELTEQIAQPDVMADQERWRELVKEHAHLEPIVQAYRQYVRAQTDLEAARAMVRESTDEETRHWLREEVEQAEQELAELEQQLRRMLMQKDPRDDKNVIVEIRAGAGGEEAALFAADLFRMYSRYAERQNWRTEVISVNETGIGGYKEIIFNVQGKGAFSRLKYESGTHRVQRIPTTESGGRIHTSTATVAVLPEVEEVDITINPDELQIDTYRAGGAGGQHVNKTESAIRITHLPTGIVVTCQDDRSQHKNKAKAMKVLMAKLHDLAQREQAQEVAEQRKLQVGTGDRSERIRTYNFPDGRITDHRIGLTLYKLEQILDGALDELFDALQTYSEAELIGRAGPSS